MADKIQLLPDAIANQIAAGEVIQRPASVVKELMENAIDAGAQNIQLIVKDAGKSLIQVIDDGSGMSETDARMAFERHATSKIRTADDLFRITSMGFRGEALASIAAIAQVEIKTRPEDQELGTRMIIEGSEVKTQEPCQCTKGTSFAVKNLFFNVPARRKFLKTNSVEMRHIMEEFQRIAMAHESIAFTLHHNQTEVFRLQPANRRQRIIGVLGGNTNKKLVPVEEKTEVLEMNGYVGKPEFAKKTRGDQFFFVNNRFIKSGYLNHAVVTAFEDMLPPDTHPMYVIFLTIDPDQLDINVHPTKQQINFDDEKLVYKFLRVAIRHALARYGIMPSLDFDQETSFASTRIRPYTPPAPSSVETFPSKMDEDEDETNKGDNSGSSRSSFSFKNPSQRERSNQENWQKAFEGLDLFDDSTSSDENDDLPAVTIESSWSDEDNTLDDASKSFSKQQKKPYQIHGSYIISQIKSGFLVIDQQYAHERILYEKYLNALEQQQTISQQQLFPVTIELSTMEAAMLESIRDEINLLGFDIAPFGQGTFIINGIPSGMSGKVNQAELIEQLLEQYRSNLDLKLDLRENIARSMARSSAIKKGQYMSEEEMQSLIDQLFACEQPTKSPSGKNCVLTFDLDDLIKRFNN
ncbi:MAG: DNA mismatch repair endonuclease MutL [Saprospiraceae bacterium]|nr:DNA mismatch repair endonuclease MutL [Saprospiraceae bacterium]